MADEITSSVEVEGLDDLEHALEKIKTGAKTALRRALRSAGGVLQAAAEELVPKDTGFLASQIKIGTRVDDAGMTAKVGVKSVEYPDQGNRRWHRTAADVAHFTEYGTETEEPRPFMRPAFDANVDNMVEEFFSKLHEEMDKL